MINRNNTLPLVMLRKLELIFKNHKWNLESEDEKELFESFCQMLLYFSKDQQECILELTNHFLRIELADYSIHIRRCLNSIDQSLLESTTRFYLMPICDEKGYENGNNSSNLLAYLFKDKWLVIRTPLQDKELSVVIKPSLLPVNFNHTPYKVILVDDFIGSGGTVLSCLDFLANLGFDLSKVIILSLVIQNQGYELIRERNIPILSSVCCGRGINDNYQDPLRERLCNIMGSIEDLMQVKPILRFGYNQTEALVKMIRTPNNTFPVFWEDCKLSNGKYYTSPFPRQQKFSK